MSDETPDDNRRLEPIPYATPVPRPRRAGPVAWILLGLLILAVLSFILSSFVHRRAPANRINKSVSNLSQIGAGLLLYANDFSVYPPDFETLFVAEDLPANVFVNPSTNDTDAPGATKAAQAQSLVKVPGHCSYVYASPNYVPQPSVTTRIDAHERLDPKSTGANFLFSDGHVQWIPNPEAARLIAELNLGHNPPRPVTAAGSK